MAISFQFNSALRDNPNIDLSNQNPDILIHKACLRTYLNSFVHNQTKQLSWPIVFRTTNQFYCLDIANGI